MQTRAGFQLDNYFCLELESVILAKIYPIACKPIIVDIFNQEPGLNRVRFGWALIATHNCGLSE